MSLWAPVKGQVQQGFKPVRLKVTCYHVLLTNDTEACFRKKGHRHTYSADTLALLAHTSTKGCSAGVKLGMTSNRPFAQEVNASR